MTLGLHTLQLATGAVAEQRLEAARSDGRRRASRSGMSARGTPGRLAGARGHACDEGQPCRGVAASERCA
jgi:hypothetical protein